MPELRHFKKILNALILLSFFQTPALFAACKLCEKIREENAKKVNPYEYYEDYLEDQKKAKAEEIDFSDQDDSNAETSG
ncbi:MAG: hypothetical protein CK425_08400 [Parachlamydia sp.]|nr:MAG: hypothetical protein CK425_08400 [Parachlamydia sp.]